MQNVKYEVSPDNILNIQVDLNKEFGLSKSQKTTVVGSTQGFVNLDKPAGTMFSLNVNKRVGGN